MIVLFTNRMYRLLLVLFGFGLLLPQYGSAQETSTEAEIRTLMIDRDVEIKGLLETADTDDAIRIQLKQVINGIIDLREMSKISIGKHWNALSEVKKDSFVTVFSQIVQEQSISNLDIYRSKISYDKVEVSGTSAVVTTSTVYKSVPATVVYHLHKDESTNNTWMAGDFVLDDVSTTQGYAKSFQTVIRKRGFDALMKSLVKKRDRMSK